MDWNARCDTVYRDNTALPFHLRVQEKVKDLLAHRVGQEEFQDKVIIEWKDILSRAAPFVAVIKIAF